MGKNSAIIAAIAVTAAAWYWWAVRPGGVWNGSSAPAAATALPSASTSPEKVAIKPDTGGSHPGLSYAEAVRLFANQRIQFDSNCVATPAYIVLKNGAEVMFDNRYDASRYIALDGARYLLRAYDFRILTLSSPDPPHTVAVDCGSGRNNARIVLN